MKKVFLYLFFLTFLSLTVQAATIQGSIYNSQLSLEQDVLIQISTTPEQKFLSKDGHYQFSAPLGEYTLTARKGATTVTEEVLIQSEGVFIYDLFLIPDLVDEEEIWNSTDEDYSIPQETSSFPWSYVLLGIIILAGFGRLMYMRKKYGALKLFRKKIEQESKKTIEQHKIELAKDPSYLEKALEIIKKNDGRINQKDLRREMAYLSEAKISLIVTELEHKGVVERIKKGRGNV